MLKRRRIRVLSIFFIHNQNLFSGSFDALGIFLDLSWRGKRASTRCWRGGRERRKGEASSCQWSEPSSPGPSPPREGCTSPCGSGWGWAAPRRQLLLRIWRGSGRGPKKSGQSVPARPEPRMNEIQRHTMWDLRRGRYCRDKKSRQRKEQSDEKADSTGNYLERLLSNMSLVSDVLWKAKPLDLSRRIPKTRQHIDSCDKRHIRRTF